MCSRNSEHAVLLLLLLLLVVVVVVVVVGIYAKVTLQCFASIRYQVFLFASDLSRYQVFLFASDLSMWAAALHDVFLI